MPWRLLRTFGSTQQAAADRDNHFRFCQTTQPRRDTSAGSGAAKKVTLAVFTTQLAQELQLAVRLDSFCDAAKPEIVRQPDDGTNDDLILTVRAYSSHEAAIQLDSIDLESSKMR